MRRKLIWVLTLFAFLLPGIAPHALASWECDGRICSTSPWLCCCDSGAGGQDDNCRTPGPASNSNMACGSGCGCVLVISDRHVSCPEGTPVLLAPAFAPVLLPAAVRIDPPRPTECVARSVELRGPPVRRLCLATPSLRGPPALGVDTGVES